MTHFFTKQIATGLLAFTLIISETGLAQAIQMRPTPGSGGDLKVEVKADKAMLQVGEPIRFSVIGNRGFYLYVFGIDEQRRQGYLLLPNRLERGNYYGPGTAHPVPGRAVEFFSDKPGVEKIIFVASTKKIDLNTGRYSKSGGFLIADADTVRTQIKSIRLRPVHQAQQASTEITVTVR